MQVDGDNPIPELDELRAEPIRPLSNSDQPRYRLRGGEQRRVN
jgi:hypothetical protein